MKLVRFNCWRTNCPSCDLSLTVKDRRASRYCDNCSFKKEYVKQFAHRVVASAIRAGSLRPVTKLHCKDCGALAAAYDHRDYLAPLNVQAVCDRCNLSRGVGSPFDGSGLPEFLKAKMNRRQICEVMNMHFTNWKRRGFVPDVNYDAVLAIAKEVRK